jgi:hypothetical protein
MTEALAGRGGRVLGKSLLTLANVITAAAPVAADWNARTFSTTAGRRMPVSTA